MAEGRTKWPPVEDDWFVEPPWVTDYLLDRETFEGRILDPSCGQGNIVKACLARGLDAIGSDLRERDGAKGEPWFIGTADLRSCMWLEPNIISNPPYGHAKLAEEFIWTWALSPGTRKLAVFVNSKFMFGGARAAGLFKHWPPSRIYPITPRPSCPPGVFLAAGGKATGGVENFVWMVWDRLSPPGVTTLHWANEIGSLLPPSDLTGSV